MEREIEEEVTVEDEGGGLEIRQRKRGKIGKEDEEKVINGGEHSVYFKAEEEVWKCRHCTWIYHLSGPGMDLTQKHEGNCQVAMDSETLTQLGTYIGSPIKVELHNGCTYIEQGYFALNIDNMRLKCDNYLVPTGADVDNVTVGLKDGEVDKFDDEKNPENGKADIRAKDFDTDDNVHTEEENHNLRNAVTENGSNSHLSSEENNVNRVTRNEIEIQESKKFTPGKLSKFIDAEFDVESFLEEQETHDLYCPNCHSCITKRVILRKRKRYPRENQSDLPPQKVQHVPEASSAPNETVDHDDETAFRCLSCFSFFIPTESGFNIFRIFGKKDGSINLQSSEKIPSNNVNWVSSLFGSGSSRNKGNEEDPLAGKSYCNGGQLGNQAQGEKESYHTTTVLEDHSAGESYISGGQMDNQAQVENQSYLATTASKDPSAGKSYSNGGHIGNQAQQDKQSYPATIVSEDQAAGQSYSNGGLLGNRAQEDKQSDPQTTVSKDPLAGESYYNQAQGDEKSYPATTISEDTSAGVPYTNGGLMGNRAQGDDQSNLVPAVLEGISTSNGNIKSSMRLAANYLPPGNNINKPICMVKPASPRGTTESNQYLNDPGTSNAVETFIDVGVQGVDESGSGNDWDVLKSIVYGGLIESITSLCVVSSAAGSDSSTLHVCALGLANLIGGLFLIAHDLYELQSEHDDEATSQRDQRSGRYWNKLGKREHFRLHAVVSILSYIIFGLLPPVIYGFAFRKSDNKEHKIIATASSSLFCVALLAIGKAHVRLQKNYFKSLMYYLAIAMPASGLSYVAGVMINRLLVVLGLFVPSQTSPSPPSSIELLRFGPNTPSWDAF